MSNADSHQTGYLNSVSRVFAKNRLLTALLVLMVILKAWDSVQISLLRANWEQIVIPPPPLEPYRIKQNSASANYLVDMSHYLVNLWGNVTPITVREKYNILLSLFHEKSFPRYKDRLQEIQGEIEKYSTISHMMDLDPPDAIQIKENHLSIKIRRYKVVGTTVKPAISGSLEIDFVIEGGQFKILDMEEKS